MAAGSTDDIARFFDRASCCAAARSARPTLSRVAKALLADVDAIGVAGRSVLDAGCGTGALSLALAQRGASRVIGVDLSPESVVEARRGAGDQAPGRVTFEVGDAATAALEPSDVVVLNKVVCCYFDAGALLANTLPAARRVFAMSLPASRGLRGTLARLVLAAENGWRRLRRDPFRAFVHDVRGVTTAIEEAGFRPRRQRNLGIWQVAVFEHVDPTGP